LCEDEPRVPCTSGLVVTSDWPLNYNAEGQYFGFDNAAATEFFGTPGYSSQVYPVRNSRGYRGEIKVYKSSKNCGNCGRYEKYGKSEPGDWQVGDIICHNDDDSAHGPPADHPLELCETSLQVTNGHPGKYRPKGMYFGFDNACMDLWYGSSDWHFKTIEVKAPNGKVGEVQFYKDNENCKMSCGRWIPEDLASGGDWNMNDLLVMANPRPHHTPDMCESQLQITKEVSGGSRACVDNDCVQMFFGLSSSKSKWPSSATIKSMDGKVGKIALFKDSSKCGCSCIRWSPSSAAKDGDWTFRELLYHGELDCADSTSPIKRKCKCAGESCAAGKYCYGGTCNDNRRCNVRADVGKNVFYGAKVYGHWNATTKRMSMNISHPWDVTINKVSFNGGSDTSLQYLTSNKGSWSSATGSDPCRPALVLDVPQATFFGAGSNFRITGSQLSSSLRVEASEAISVTKNGQTYNYNRSIKNTVPILVNLITKTKKLFLQKIKLVNSNGQDSLNNITRN